MHLTLIPDSLTTKAQFYDAVGPDGRVWATSRQSFLEAARALLAAGHDPAEELTARHDGSTIVAMRGTIGEAARWTCGESDRAGMRMALWEPYRGPTRSAEPDE